MPLTIARRAKKCITAHGLNVYPLEGFGLLLGHNNATDAHALAALPVGKTEHWYEPTGRFARVFDAFAMATSLFAVSQLRPIGLYCTVYSSFRPYPESLVATAPRLPELPWLVLRSVNGGEAIFGCWAKRLEADEWIDDSLTTVFPRIEAPDHNPRRIATAWNRAWGILDYGNLHEIELPRLGLDNQAL